MRYLSAVFYIGFCFLVMTQTLQSYAAEITAVNESEMVRNEVPVAEPGEFAGSVPSLLSDREFFLSITAIIFGLVVLWIEYKLLIRISAGSDQVLKVLIVSTIVIATMFIIAAGYRSEQIAPAIGLFGTIAGYLLGRGERSLTCKQKDKEND